MKSICTDCTYFQKGVCIKNQKNGYNNCKKFKSIPIPELQKEYKMLLVSGENNVRMLFLQKKLEDINGGYI